MSRRRVIGGGAALTALLGVPARVRAMTGAEAADFIRALVARLGEISGPGVVDPAMLAGVLGLLEEFSDVGIIARSSLGVAWRTASDEQKDRYIKVFGRYLARKYSRIFADYRISELVVSGTRKVTSGYMVSSLVRLDDGASYGIEWQVVAIGGRPVMLNLTVEGISMLASERKEITEMLDKNGNRLDGLIAELDGFSG